MFYKLDEKTNINPKSISSVEYDSDGIITKVLITMKSGKEYRVLMNESELNYFKNLIEKNNLD